MTEDIKLTHMTKTAGWAAKIGPGTLARVLGNLPKFNDENLLVGVETSDDAAIYKVSDDLALIQTLDFFTPIVDDPYLFGQIAAANSLSDVYAMGGEPKTALNIVGFPNCLDPKILGRILEGGASKVLEAGAILAGAGKECVSQLEKAGNLVGVAFQIKDDILDVTSTQEVLGKPVFSDEKNNKTTYVTLYGMEKAAADVENMSEKAESIVKSIGDNEFLIELINKLISREK